jgi:hypothetical protein
MGEKGLSLPRIFFCEFAATVLAVSVFEAFVLLVPTDQSAGYAVVGEVLYAFLYIPILADRLEKRSTVALGRTAMLVLAFTITILALSAIRELGSAGTFWGIEIFPAVFGQTPYLAHDSSAALILAALLIAVRLFLRRHGGEGFSFGSEQGTKVEVPYLDDRLEKEQFRNSAALLFATLLLGAAVLAAVYGFSLLGLPVFLLPPLAVVAQALMIGLIMSLTGKSPNRFAETIRRPFLLPLQAAFVLLPFPYIFENEWSKSAFLNDGLRYGVSLIILWLFSNALLAFIRTFKRKMLFGRRPKSIDGLPFVFIVMSLGLIVMTAFAGLLKVTV